MSTQIIWINNHYGNTDHHGPLSLKTRFSNQKLLKNRIQYKAEKEIREALSPLNENGGEVEKTKPTNHVIASSPSKHQQVLR